MKTKTIKKTISKKISDWLESIDDKAVREACNRDLIVTGGSIASMLLREEVNDYDIYFKTAETVTMVSDYYVKKINKIYKNNISNSTILTVDSNDVPVMDYSNPEDTNKWNHFVESLKRSEGRRVKVYIPHIGFWRRSDENASKDVKSVKAGTYEPIYLTENAITLSDDIQLVIRFFGDAATIHENYDFVHATNYFHYQEGKATLELRPDALEALLTKELQYIGSKYPLTSVIRTKKFIGRGYSCSAGTYLKILWQVAELDLKDPVVLQEQLVGVDIAYFSLLIKAISEVDPKELNYNFISSVIDKVFNEFDE